MLRVSKLADYGTVVMVHLAKQGEQVCNARDIARDTHLTVPTVSKLLKRLTSKGLLNSTRGAMGGYCLKRSAHEITLADVIYAFEAYRGMTECSQQPNRCSLQDVCHVQGNWQQISQVIESVLKSVSLEMLAKPQIPTEKIEQMKRKAIGVIDG